VVIRLVVEITPENFMHTLPGIIRKQIGCIMANIPLSSYPAEFEID